MKRELDHEIAKELRDLDILRQLNEKRRDEKIFKNPKDEDFLKRVMGKLISKNEEISKLLGLNGDIANNIIKKTLKKRIEKHGSVFKPKRYPSFVRFKKIAPGNIKMLPQNGECKLFLETDIEEVYREKKQDRETPISVWDDKDYNWCGEDICKIWQSSKEGSLVDAIAINMDADTLHDYIRKRKLTDRQIENTTRLYRIGIYLISLITFFQLSHREDIENKEELVSYLMRGVGKIIIHVVINEEIIKEIEREEI